MTLGGLITALPEADIVAAIQDPSNLGKEAQVAEDIISVAMPGLTGAMIAALVQLFVVFVYSQGGGTITPDPLPMTDAQLKPNRGGRNP